MAVIDPSSLREAQKQLTRSRLVDAAARLFAAEGYAATTIEDIARAAGATRATFYLHFASKSDLVDGLYDVVAEFDPDYRELIAVAYDPSAEELAEWLRRFIDGREGQRTYWTAISAAAGAAPEARAKLEENFDRSAAKLAAGLTRARSLSEHHAYLIAVVLKRQLDVVNDPWIRAHWASQHEQLFRVLAGMWLAALSR